MRPDYYLGSLLVAAAATTFCIINYWQIFHVEFNIPSIARYVILTAGFQIAAAFFLFVGLRLLYQATSSIWITGLTYGMIATIAATIVQYCLSGKIPVRGEVLGILLAVAAVLVSVLWK